MTRVVKSPGLEPLPYLLNDLIFDEDRDRRDAVGAELVRRDPLQALVEIIPFLRDLSEMSDSSNSRARSAFRSILKKAKSKQEQWGSFVRLLFDTAVAALRENQNMLQRLGSSRIYVSGEISTDVVPFALESFSSSDAEILLSNQSLIELLLVAAAGFGEEAKSFSEVQLRSHSREIECTACRLYCLSAGFPNDKLDAFLSEDYLALNVLYAASTSDHYARETSLGIRLRSAVVAAGRHVLVRNEIANSELRPSFNERRILAGEVCLPLLRYSEGREAMFTSLLQVQGVISRAVSRLAEDDLSSVLEELLFRFGDVAVGALVSALSSSNLALAASRVLVRIGEPSVGPLMEFGRSSPENRPLVKRTLLQIDSSLLSFFAEEAKKDLARHGSLSDEFLSLATLTEKDIPQLVRLLSSEEDSVVAAHLLAQLDKQVTPVVKPLLQGEDAGIATVALLSFGTQGAHMFYRTLGFKRRNSLLAFALNQKGLFFYILSSATRHAGITRSHGALLESRIGENLPEVLRELTRLEEKDCLAHPVVRFIQSTRGARLARQLVFALEYSRSNILQQLILSQGLAAMSFLRLLLDGDTPSSLIAEDLIRKLDIPNEQKAAWLLSLLPGASAARRLSVVRLLSSMAVKLSVSTFQKVLQSSEDEKLKFLALKGICRLSNSLRTELLAELLQVFSAKDTHLSFQAFKAFSDLGETLSSHLTCLKARRKRVAARSPFAKQLDSLIQSLC